MKSIATLILFSIAVLTCYSQDYFASSVWNFKIQQISEPFIIQDEHNNYTASFDLEDEGLMLLEIYPKDRKCESDTDCLNNALDDVIKDIINQDPAVYAGLIEKNKFDNNKSGYTGIRTLYSNEEINAIVDLYITDGYFYILSITTLKNPEKYYPYFDTFEFLEEAKEHGERRH